jgi:hypothetical protein
MLRQLAGINVWWPKQQVQSRTEKPALNYYDRHEPYPAPLGVSAQNGDEYQQVNDQQKGNRQPKARAASSMLSIAL